MQQEELYSADSQNIEYFPPTLFSFLFTSLNHCCLSVDNSRLLDLCLRWMLEKEANPGLREDVQVPEVDWKDTG